MRTMHHHRKQSVTHKRCSAHLMHRPRMLPPFPLFGHSLVLHSLRISTRPRLDLVWCEKGWEEPRVETSAHRRLLPLFDLPALLGPFRLACFRLRLVGVGQVELIRGSADVREGTQLVLVASAGVLPATCYRVDGALRIR